MFNMKVFAKKSLAMALSFMLLLLAPSFFVVKAAQTENSVNGVDEFKKVEPKVSVIIPVYNVDPWLYECMDSVVNQTLREIEIICVNDGSTDSSLRILREYESRDSRVTVVDQENQGVSVARNVGIELAMRSQSKYIAFVDSDDYLELNTFETAYNQAVMLDADVVVWGTEHFKTYQEKKKTNRVFDYTDETNKKNSRIKIYVWDKLYKKNLIKLRGLRFIKGIQYAEDVMFNREVFKCSPRIRFLRGVFYHHREEIPNSLSAIGRRENIV